MLIEKRFSSYDDYGYEDERVYSVLMDEDELRLYSEFLERRSYSTVGKDGYVRNNDGTLRLGNNGNKIHIPSLPDVDPMKGRKGQPMGGIKYSTPKTGAIRKWNGNERGMNNIS